MTLDDMLAVLAALVGMFGLIFLTKGVLRRAPGATAACAARQKADMVSGAVLVVLALCFQIVNILFVDDGSMLTRTRLFRFFYWIDFLLACVVAFLIGSIALWKNRTLAERYEAETGTDADDSGVP